jgi:hypothetical protein
VPAAIFYLLALRTWFPASWADLSAALRRVVPRPVRAAVRLCRLGPLLGRWAGFS